MSKVLLVLAHPRRTSLTAQVADRFAALLSASGHEIEWADLITEGFNPVMHEADEPDWNDAEKIYSAEVLREMQRIRRNDATVMIFPVYWWSVPAILKGWIDRVWNHGFAYGSRKYPHRRVWMIGVAGNRREDYAKRRYDEAMRISLDVGLLSYCAVAERRFELLHGSIEGSTFPSGILREAEVLAAQFCLVRQ